MDENISLKERTRYAMHRTLDPNTEENLSRKENERLQRENKNLLKSLQNHKVEFEVLQKRLKKSETSNQTKVC